MPSVLESLNSALHRAFVDHDGVYLLGEDILDPYGGAFKVTRGLSSRFPERVLTTPVSEAGFVGIATGMALRGLRPVVEIMFGDFITLIADQVINHIAKFPWMYNGQVNLPMVIRTPMGGRRGYGPTHSQTLEKLFLGIPGLRVIAPAALCRPDESGGPGDLLYQSILDSMEPTLFIENKLQYYLPVQSQADLHDFVLEVNPAGQGMDLPMYSLSIRSAPAASLTIAAYGYMAELAKQAALKLAYEHEVFVEVVIPTQLSPFVTGAISASAHKSGRLLVVEEGTISLGWGAEVIARTAEALSTQSIQYKRLAARDLPVPCSGPLEEQVLPGIGEIVATVAEMVQ